MDMFWMWKYLSGKQLAGFDKYKYNSVDTSPLANYVMHPFWNQVVKICPRWLAPNLMTFLGWLLTVSIALTLAYFDWDITKNSSPNTGFSKIPRWIWLYCAISQFMSHTLDGTDGKQARQTKTSSPLGELFDHGLDSSAVWLMPLSVMSIFGFGYHSSDQWEYHIALITIMTGFYLAHWEKYNTSVMFLPWAYDISQVFLVLAYSLAYIYSPDIFRVTIYDGWTLTHCFRLSLHVTLWVLGLPVSLRNIIRVRYNHPERCPSLFEGQMPFVPLITIFSLSSAWAWWSPKQVLNNDPRMFYVLVGTLFSNISCRLIVSQMSDTKCQRFNWLTLPLFPIVLLALLNIGNERLMLYVYTIFVIISHVHYGVCVVNQLCDHLHIRCFHITEQLDENSNTRSNKMN